MGQYKLSKYVYIDERDDDIFLYNTNKIDMVRMNKGRYYQLLNELDKDTLNLEQSSISYLVSKTYIVKCDKNENRVADYTYIQNCHSNRQLLLTILPTEGCNFRCEYCYEEHKTNIMTENVQESVIKFVRNNLKFYGGLVVSWFGGEPLLQPEVIEHLTSEFKQICKNNKKPYNSIMTTNGYLLNYEMFQRMKKCNVTYYQITLDGLAEMHDKQRFLADGAPTFDTIVKNLREIKEKESSKLYTFSIRTNLTVKSLESYPKFVKFLNENFLDDQRFKQRVRLAWNGTKDKEYDGNVISGWDSVSSGSGIDMQNEINKQIYSVENESWLREAFLEQMTTQFPCYAAKSNSFIFGPDGRVFKCTVHFDDCEDGIIGVLNDAGHIEFNEEIYVKWVTQPTTTDRQKCYDCVVYPICQGVGCPYKMAILGQRVEQCEDKKNYIIDTYRVFSFNKILCKNIQEI